MVILRILRSFLRRFTFYDGRVSIAPPRGRNLDLMIGNGGIVIYRIRRPWRTWAWIVIEGVAITGAIVGSVMALRVVFF